MWMRVNTSALKKNSQGVLLVGIEEMMPTGPEMFLLFHPPTFIPIFPSLTGSQHSCYVFPLSTTFLVFCLSCLPLLPLLSLFWAETVSSRSSSKELIRAPSRVLGLVGDWAFLAKVNWDHQTEVAGTDRLFSCSEKKIINSSTKTFWNTLGLVCLVYPSLVQELFFYPQDSCVIEPSFPLSRRDRSERVFCIIEESWSASRSLRFPHQLYKIPPLCGKCGFQHLEKKTIHFQWGFPRTQHIA